MSQENIESPHAASHRRWKKARHAELAGPDSWLGLVGLYWLSEGKNALGSGSAAVIQVPAGPAHQGDVIWQGETLYWQPLEGVAAPLQTDAHGQATQVDLGRYRFFVVERDGRMAVRLRDRSWAEHQVFSGLDYFSYDPAWQIEAQWVQLAEPLLMEVPNVSGDLKPVTVMQAAVFTVEGEETRLLPMSVTADEVFFVLRDRTSGKESYGAGRFLKTKPAEGERIVLDFNFAYNPPCAFTPFATCPLPPAENWLPFPVLAGEKKYLEVAH